MFAVLVYCFLSYVNSQKLDNNPRIQKNSLSEENFDVVAQQESNRQPMHRQRLTKPESTFFDKNPFRFRKKSTQKSLVIQLAAHVQVYF